MGVWRLLGRLVGSLLNVSVCCLWVCVGCLGDCFECLSMGLHGPLSVSVAYSGHSPKLQAHPHKHIPIHSTSYRRLDYIPKRVSQATGTPHKKHTDTFHKLPTTRLHPEQGTIKKQAQTIKQATETLHKHLRPCSVCRSLGFHGPPCASLGLRSFLWPISQATATHP